MAFSASAAGVPSSISTNNGGDNNAELFASIAVAVLAVAAVLFVEVVAFSPEPPELEPVRGKRRGVATSAGDLRGEIGDGGGEGGGGGASAIERDLSVIMSGSVVLILDDVGVVSLCWLFFVAAASATETDLFLLCLVVL